MLPIKILFIVSFWISLSFSQGRMNAFGIGNLYLNQGSEIASSDLSILAPSFQKNVSLTNPSTWHDLKYTFLSISYSLNQVQINTPSNINGYSSLSNVSWIIPIKSKTSFGISMAPYSDQRVQLTSKDTSTFIAYNDTLEVLQNINRTGGLMSFKFSGSYKINEKISFGSTLNFLFGSSRTNESILFNSNSSIIQNTRRSYNGLLSQIYLSFKLSERTSIYGSLMQTLKPLESISLKKGLFEDLNNNEYHDFYSPIYDFPNPDSLDISEEIKLKELHNPFSYSFSISNNLNDRSKISLEMHSYNELSKNVESILLPLNNWIDKSSSQKISYTRFADDLSLNPFDKMIFRVGFINKNHVLEKNKSEVSEVGFLIGIGFKFKPVGNQLDFGYYHGSRKYSNFDGTELVQQIQISTSLSDLWFVKRRQK